MITCKQRKAGQLVQQSFEQEHWIAFYCAESLGILRKLKMLSALSDIGRTRFLQTDFRPQA